MLMTCPKCGQLTKGQTGDQCPKCKIFLRPAAEMGEQKIRREQMEIERPVATAAETAVRKCPRCGAVESSEGAKFCSKCGVELPQQNATEKQAPKKGGGAFTVIFWIIIILLLMSWGKANHQKWVDEQMKHFRGTDYTYSDKELQREIDKIYNTFGR